MTEKYAPPKGLRRAELQSAGFPPVDFHDSENISANPARFEKPLKMFIGVTLLCLCGILIWLMGITPFRPFTRIDITGYSTAGIDLVLRTAGITPSLSYFTANTASMEAALMSLGVFESARVFRYFPSRLQVILVERRPVAQALASMNGRTVPVLIDRQGVVFMVGGFSASLSAALPVISGIIIEDPFPGMRLPGLFIPLFSELDAIINSAPELLAAVSELRVNRGLFETYDLTLYPVHRRIRVRLSELSEEMLRYTLLMVDVLASREGNIDTLDFRSGIASYIPMGVSF